MLFAHPPMDWAVPFRPITFATPSNLRRFRAHQAGA
jgi:hypothetical protein